MDAGSHDEFADNTAIKLEPIDEVDVKRSLSGKRERNFGSDPFSEGEERNIRQKLDVGLSRNETMQRPGPGGSRLTYIEGWKVIHDANQIFGFNGWSSRLVTLDLRYVDESNHRFSACVSATVRITLRDGSYREDRGGGAADNMRSKGDAILKAEKEAVTDATKRALKNFGLRLGLSLYDRQHVREMNRPQQPKAPVRQLNAAQSSGAHTPQASRAAPGSSHGVPAQGYGVSPVTPGASSKAPMPNGGGGTTAKCIGNAHEAKGGQFAAQRELALKRKQAFLQAKAAEERANMQRGNAHSAGNGQAGTATNSYPAAAAAITAERHGSGAAVGTGRSAVAAVVEGGNAFPGGGAPPRSMHRPGSSSGGAGFSLEAERAAGRLTIGGSEWSRGYGAVSGSGKGCGGTGADMEGCVPQGAVGGRPQAAGARDGGSKTADLARRQQEIDELSRMALADF